jgi:catechol 2,3-dioxygenase
LSYKLGLVSLYFRDVARARAFYVDTLGLQVVAEFSGPDFVFLRPAGGTPIALRDAGALPLASHAEPGGFDIGLEVDNVDATLGDWRAKGIDIVKDVQDMGAGRVFLARDPEGHLLSVYQLYDQVRTQRQQYGV